jgi:phosphonatase-like hydrolase
MDAIKLVIFDVAGTIVEDRGEVLGAFSTALERHGVAHTTAELKEWKGASKLEVIRHFVERQAGPTARDSTIAAVYAAFRVELERHYRDGGVLPIPGAAEIFQWLCERDILIATTSGFYREISELILELTGWRDVFSARISSSDVPMGRPAPYMIFRAMEAAGVTSVGEVVNVGDTPLDLQAGTNAGVREVVGVLTGLHGRERLQREPHTCLLGSVAELPAWMDGKGCLRSCGPSKQSTRSFDSVRLTPHFAQDDKV